MSYSISLQNPITCDGIPSLVPQAFFSAGLENWLLDRAGGNRKSPAPVAAGEPDGVGICGKNERARGKTAGGGEHSRFGDVQ